MALQHYRDLIAWQKAMDFAEAVHLAVRKFPKEEVFALTSQLRRSAVSVPSNVAEGQGRTTTRDFIHFLRTAHGSLQDAETQIILANRFDYLTRSSTEDLLGLAGEVGRLNYGLIRSLIKRGTKSD